MTIGTGENDYNIRLNSVKIDKRVSYLSSIGYTLTGDSSTASYNDLLSLSAGVGKQVNQELYLSISLNYVTAYIKGADASLSSMAYIAYTFTDSWFVTGSYSLGLSDAVPDYSVNMGLGFKF